MFTDSALFRQFNIQILKIIIFLQFSSTVFLKILAYSNLTQSSNVELVDKAVTHADTQGFRNILTPNHLLFNLQ